MLKNILGGLFAVIAGMACVSISLVFSHKFYTAPEGLDPNDIEDRIRLAEAMTREAKTIIISGHMIGAFLAGLIASKISSHAKFGTGMVASMVIVIATITNVIAMRHNMGYSALLIFATLFAAYAGARVGSGNQVYIDK